MRNDHFDTDIKQDRMDWINVSLFYFYNSEKKIIYIIYSTSAESEQFQHVINWNIPSNCIHSIDVNQWLSFVISFI